MRSARPSPHVAPDRRRSLSTLHRINLLRTHSVQWLDCTLRLSGLRPILMAQLERNRRTRSYGYECGDFVQSELIRTRSHLRTLVQHAG